ncbi:MAG: hypothetical protein RLO38_04185 [Roseovarius confluentis]
MMKEQPAKPTFLLTVLFAIWAMCFAYSFVSFAVTAPSGDGFTRGLNRISSFLGWQGIAGLLSIVLWVLGRSWPRGSSVRRMSVVPIWIALLLLALLIGIVLWANMG